MIGSPPVFVESPEVREEEAGDEAMRRRLRDLLLLTECRRGTVAMEYALLLALIAVALILTLNAAGLAVETLYGSVAGNLGEATPGGG